MREGDKSLAMHSFTVPHPPQPPQNAFFTLAILQRCSGSCNERSRSCSIRMLQTASGRCPTYCRPLTAPSNFLTCRSVWRERLLEVSEYRERYRKHHASARDQPRDEAS
jgi:hypothetical protein